MDTKQKEEIELIIALWKKNNVTSAEMEFNCGGDSMGDTQWQFYFEDNAVKVDKEVSEIEGYLDRVVYDKVDFYVNSDGEYMGESGTVYVSLEDDEESFQFSKSATSEFREMVEREFEIELTDEESAIYNKYITSIDGSQDGVNNVIYKNDFIIPDKDNEVITAICEDIKTECSDYDDYDMSEDMGDWFDFTIDRIEDNKLKVTISREFIIFRDSD
jgi:hypothetical protein